MIKGDNYSTKNNGVAQSHMAYYWSSTCHNTYVYGMDIYNSQDKSECDNHNDYAGSKIRQAVEEYMNNYLDASDLKEVNGYKIRLITKDELEQNLGFVNNVKTSATGNWVCNDWYWTMTPVSSKNIWFVDLNGRLGNYDNLTSRKVRPVINLLKSSIVNQ